MEQVSTPARDDEGPEYEITTPAALGWTKIADKTWRDLEGRIHQFSARERLTIRIPRKKLSCL